MNKKRETVAVSLPTAAFSRGITFNAHRPINVAAAERERGGRETEKFCWRRGLDLNPVIFANV